MTKITRRHAMAIGPALLVSACAPRGMIVKVPPVPGETVQPIFVVTDREVDADFYPTGERGTVTSFGRIDVRIPANHEVGQVEYPVEGRNNTEAFGALRLQKYPDAQTLVRDVGTVGSASDEILMFIHGFNNTMAEGIYRHAQIAKDLSLTGPQISYSWPSSASAFGYLADRDSVAIARDGLERLLHNLSVNQHRKVRIFAHSMGSLLLMEALRQMSIGEDFAGFDRISGIVLMSPDINIDLFEKQIMRIKTMPDDVLVAVSNADKALRLSQFLSGGAQRLGEVEDAERLNALGIGLVDLSNIDDGDPLGHSTFVTSPTSISLIRNLRRASLTGGAQARRRAVLEFANPMGAQR